MNELYTKILIAGCALLAGLISTLLISRFLTNSLSKLTSRTRSKTDDYILKILLETIKPLGLIISASISWRILEISGDFNQVFVALSKLIFLILIVRLVNRVVIRFIQSWGAKINDPAVGSMLRSLSPMVRAAVWSVGSVFYLQNMGVQMAALWAILSAGGIGAGLALKEPVQEFFEYITILLDKPFQNGQFIHIDGVWAKVERVGVRSTRLRSINGEVIVMSNSNLTNGIISNYAEMENRRLVHRLGVVYQTSHSKMKKIPEIIKSIIDKTENAVYDRCHFVEFGNSSLDFELVYYIPTNDYLSAMRAQEEINLEIMRIFEAEKIDFAFPTQTINLLNSK
ncbi:MULTISPECIES: mechanosensitive ion channel family protein [Prochlorococcus]|uniref:mechanosensitive ion channel family protein n=1 Tax=Prochlorococcus TaxID=1218 RepID=UPI0005337726|nr:MULTISPECIES: mechanosensitive ion channel family protein [Prochlorococcus]KGG12596.1 Small mechanosensitive ion channel [Prochlorococcus sp. MIT 0601]